MCKWFVNGMQDILCALVWLNGIMDIVCSHVVCLCD